MVPIRSFQTAKSRLAGVLSDVARRDLARRCADVVMAACQPFCVFVVSDDPEVADWASDHGARVIRPGRPGLNEAAVAGREAARLQRFNRVLVVHADLPRAEPLGTLPLESADVVIVPDRRADGTNVLLVPCTDDFVFQYGPGSYLAHVAEASRCGLTSRVVQRADLALDLDTIDDLREAGINDATASRLGNGTPGTPRK